MTHSMAMANSVRETTTVDTCAHFCLAAHTHIFDKRSFWQTGNSMLLECQIFYDIIGLLHIAWLVP